MPELPEVEAWVRELDPLVSRAAIEKAGPAHIATLKTFDPPLSALEGRRLAGSRRHGKNLVFPIEGDDLVVRVHLMSAGRLRYLTPSMKGPRTPMFRLRFTDGGELVLTEAGKKKRAGVWLVSPAQLDHDLAHLGPDALDVDAEALAEILGRERRQLPPLPPPPRGTPGVGRPPPTRSPPAQLHRCFLGTRTPAPHPPASPAPSLLCGHAHTLHRLCHSARQCVAARHRPAFASRCRLDCSSLQRARRLETR